MGVDKAKEMLVKALEMEQKGKDFLSKAVSTCENELGKKMLKMILEDEEKHIVQIREIYTSLKEGKGWTEELVGLPTNMEDIKEFFDGLERQHDLVRACSDDIAAVKIGMDFEKASMEFYQSKLKLATDNLEREFIKRMIIEEKVHYDALSELYAYFTDPEGWMEMKQGFKMDSD